MDVGPKLSRIIQSNLKGEKNTASHQNPVDIETPTLTR